MNTSLTVKLDCVKLQRALFDNGGFTVSWYGVVPTSGFAVGMRGFEVRSAYCPTSQQIRAWAEYVRSTCPADDVPADAIPCFGGWKDADAGLWYLDVSFVFADRAQAEVIGQNNGQLAIFDLASMETIRLSERPVKGE
jgi:hypothetical protein